MPVPLPRQLEILQIYLTHFYLIWEINGRVYRHPSVVATLGHDGQRIVVLAVVLALGVLFWALVERPLLLLMHRERRIAAVERFPTVPAVAALHAHPAARIPLPAVDPNLRALLRLGRSHRCTDRRPDEIRNTTG